jgi:hypothetical protein
MLNSNKTVARAYFSHYRNFFTGKQLVAIALSLFLLMVLIASPIGEHYPLLRTWRIGAPTIVLLCLGVIYFAQGYLWSFPDTQMMLRADGAGRWSIHMAPIVSIVPWIYAKVPSDCIPKGAAAILRAAKANGFTGVIVLKSHMIGLEEKRKEQVAALIEALGGNCRVHDKGNGASLTGLEACMLTHAKRMHRRHNDREPGRAITTKTLTGVIEIEFLRADSDKGLAQERGE